MSDGPKVGISIAPAVAGVEIVIHEGCKCGPDPWTGMIVHNYWAHPDWYEAVSMTAMTHEYDGGVCWCGPKCDPPWVDADGNDTRGARP